MIIALKTKRAGWLERVEKRAFCGIRCAGVWVWTCLLLVATVSATAQTGQPAGPGPIRGEGQSGQRQQEAGKAAKTETRMTREEAKALFRSVDEILAFVSKDSKLPISHPVKRVLISRAEVNRFLTEKFDEDEGARKLERSEIVLKKFGFLDRDFHLRPFMISLLTEQIAGFYDNKTKTVNLLDWIQPEEQKPVLAHELTHALQDQRVGLSKWSGAGPITISTTVAEDNRRLAGDEQQTAREAVAEGQAMVVFLDYTLRETGKTLADAPELAARLKETVSDTSGSPILSRAPLLLQQSLLFPYADGLAFEQYLVVKKGREAAFAGVLANPPGSSFEILHPEQYAVHTPVPSLRIPDLHALLDATYAPYDLGVMGELDVRILAELFGGRQMAAALSPAWDGGFYYAAQRRTAVTAAEKESTASLGLLYQSHWKNRDSARSFMGVYAAQLARKYTGLVRRNKDEVDDSEQVYSTPEGDVLLTISGASVFTSEGFPVDLARKVRDSIASVESEGPLQRARSGVEGGSEVKGNDPALGMAAFMGSVGMVRGLTPAPIY